MMKDYLVLLSCRARWFFKYTLPDFLFELRGWRTHVRWFFSFTLRSWWARIWGWELHVVSSDNQRPKGNGDV